MDNGKITSVLVSNSEWYGCNRLQFNHKKANKSMKRAHFSWVTLLDTVRCPYNAINLLPNPHQRHPIARPLGSVFCGFKLFFYILCNLCKNVWNIMLYWMLWRRSSVFQFVTKGSGENIARCWYLCLSTHLRHDQHHVELFAGIGHARWMI